MGVVVASVLYGALLLLFILVVPSTLIAYFTRRAHPAINRRTPWLTSLASSYSFILCLALILQQFLPHLPSLSSTTFPCTIIYVLSHLYPALVLLPLCLRAIRLLSFFNHSPSISSPTPTSSPQPKPLTTALLHRTTSTTLSTPTYQLTTLLIALLLSTLAAVLLAAFDSTSQSQALSHSPSQCLLFGQWRYFVPACGALFAVFSLLVMRMSEERRDDPFRLGREMRWVWLFNSLFVVSYFVLLTLPPEVDIDAQFPLSSLIIVHHAASHVVSIIVPLVAVAQYNQRNGRQSAGSEQGIKPTSAIEMRTLEAAQVKREGEEGGRGRGGMSGSDGPNPNTSLSTDDPFAQTTSLSTLPTAPDLAMDVTNVWSMDRILFDPTANSLLLKHSDRLLCPELVLCYNAIEQHNAQQWQLDDPADLDAAYASSLGLYQEFIRVGAVHEVNVDSKIRSALRELFDKPHTPVERRAIMARDLHAKKKLRQEIERKATQHRQRRMQHGRTGLLSNTQLSHTKHSQLTRKDRPFTPSLHTHRQPQPSQTTRRFILQGTATSAIGGISGTREGAADILVIGVGDDEEGRRSVDTLTPARHAIAHTMQPDHTGELTELRAITATASHPFPVRSQRSATVHYPAPLESFIGQQNVAMKSYSAYPTFSQTLQMPLNDYAKMVEGNNGEVRSAGTTAMELSGSEAYPTTVLVEGSLADSQSLDGQREGGPDQRVRSSSSASEKVHIPSTISAIAGASGSVNVMSASTSGGEHFNHVVNYEPPSFSTESAPPCTTEEGATPVVDESPTSPPRLSQDSRASRSKATGEVSQSRALPSTPSHSKLSSLSHSTPFPLSALEVAALSSRVIWQRCQHEVKRLMETNLYLSFIRQSADFRRHRLAKRKEERAAQAARKAQLKEEALQTQQIQLEWREEEAQREQQVKATIERQQQRCITHDQIDGGGCMTGRVMGNMT